jgi:hypothetical protein
MSIGDPNARYPCLASGCKQQSNATSLSPTLRISFLGFALLLHPQYISPFEKAKQEPYINLTHLDTHFTAPREIEIEIEIERRM